MNVDFLNTRVKTPQYNGIMYNQHGLIPLWSYGPKLGTIFLTLQQIFKP
jgi:hypothetical protein